MTRSSKRKPVARVLLITALLSCISIVASAQTKQSRASKNEKLITALVHSENVRGVFGDDGMSIFLDQPEIEQLLKLRSRAIPLLIAHLDDRRLLTIATNYQIDGDHSSVTVGAASLDILTLIIRLDARFFKQKCLKGLEEGTISSCLRRGYGIYPEDFWQTGKLKAKASVFRAKQKWLAANRQHAIHFQARH